MIIVDADGYVTGFCFTPDSKPKKDIRLLELTDKKGRLKYLWPDYPEGEPVYSPQPYTPEQTEQLRKEWCQQEIRKLYSVDDEAKIQRENMISITSGQSNTHKFNEYNAAIKKIIDESKKIDFQISEVKK